jgi:hypothetical protein
MLDPISIGVAIATAQTVVDQIKKAIALGKDVKSLYGQFSSFYSAADQVHVASTKARIASIQKSDSQINAEALKMAFASKELRDHERYLKDLLFMTGNAPVWEEMMAERVRMHKERSEMERVMAEQKQKDREAAGDAFMNFLLFIAAIAMIVPIGGLAWEFLIKRG